MAKSDDWSTPPNLMAVLDKEFHFTLEVCASATNRALPGIPYMGLDNGRDALTNNWGGLQEVCFINPPYSMLPLFVTRAADMVIDSQRTVVALLPAYTDTKYWQGVIKFEASEVRFLKGRLAFLMNGQRQTTARFPSAIVVWKQTTLWPTPYISFWDWKLDCCP